MPQRSSTELVLVATLTGGLLFLNVVAAMCLGMLLWAVERAFKRMRGKR